MVLLDNTEAVGVIERAERNDPFCDCGLPMVPVVRRSQVWLECRALPSPTGRGVRGAIAALAATGHDRRLILDPA